MGLGPFLGHLSSHRCPLKIRPDSYHSMPVKEEHSGSIVKTTGTGSGQPLASRPVPSHMPHPDSLRPLVNRPSC